VGSEGSSTTSVETCQSQERALELEPALDLQASHHMMSLCGGQLDEW
jgi:hypothetical protein